MREQINWIVIRLQYQSKKKFTSMNMRKNFISFLNLYNNEVNLII